ncbi:MAP kinase-activated protein kinase 2 (Fragment) [Seminavis robusta]|uniref:MAP kinase-activated protein kinase 2 n=1 Tax=Seminavis robusta TaxID=568900 RepID=A0A9N8ELY3_9STRA
MAPSIRNPAVVAPVKTVEAIRHHSPQAAIDGDSYWNWPADVVDTDLSENSVPESSETEHCAVDTTDNKPDLEQGKQDDTTFVDDDAYWAEEPCCENKTVDVDYSIDYSSRSILGKGTRTTVRKAICRTTNDRFAIKSVRKIHTKEASILKQEASILSQLRHENIAQCHRVYEDSKSIHLVLDLCKGKEVYEEVALLAKQKKTLSESTAAAIVRQVLQAVAYCHDRGIVNRDIKLENLMFQSKYKKCSQDKIRMVDFGLATRISSGTGQMLTEKAGSPYYVAPEVLNECYNEKCDIWSLGVLTYALLCGEAPFVGASTADTLDKIRAATSTADIFHQAVWHHVSNDAKEFIRACLERDLDTRPSAQQLTEHPWIVHHHHHASKKKQPTSPMSKFLHKAFGGHR